MPLSNLPDGVTNKMIEDHCGVGNEEETVEQYISRAEHALNDWDGLDPSELIISLCQKLDYPLSVLEDELRIMRVKKEQKQRDLIKKRSP